MRTLPLCITELVQKDNYTLGVTWNDGVQSEYRLSDLQKKCPCAGCQQDASKKNFNAVDDSVKAHRIYSVGRYALRIEFTSGCSSGIYSYELLRALVAFNNNNE